MNCSQCGQALPAGQSFCARCAQANQAGGSVAYTPFTPLMLVERRISVLAYGWLVYAALEGMVGLAGLVFAQRFMGIRLNHGWGGGPFWMGGHFPLFLLKMAWVAMVVRVALAALAGYGLLQKAAWGRWVAIVAGVLTLIHPLLGTLLAIWTFVVLLNAANAAGYEAMSEG